MPGERKIKTAFILGAGRGERLRPLTDNCPKPLLPVRGRPLITYAFEHLTSVGVEQFIVNTHHFAHRYAEVFPDGTWRGFPLIFRYEPVLLGTGGGLKNIEDLVEGEDTIWVYNGDVISDLPLQRLLDAHRHGRGEVTIALRSFGRNLNVGVDETGKVCDFRFSLGRECLAYCQFTGIYLVDREFLRRIPAGRPWDIVDTFIEMVRELPGAVGGVVIDEGSWTDVGDPCTYGWING